jgi:hypothetical protein
LDFFRLWFWNVDGELAHVCIGSLGVD